MGSAQVESRLSCEHGDMQQQRTIGEVTLLWDYPIVLIDEQDACLKLFFENFYRC